MDLLKQTQELCHLYNIKPARSKGQNFLIREEIYDQILAAADLKSDDIILEVGPGFGFLTAKLAKVGKKVIAVELDDNLASVLSTGLKARGVGNVEVVNEDIMKLEIGNLKFGNNLSSDLPNYQLPITNYKIVANLPYNITSIFLRKFLSAQIKPELMVLMLQKEVAERICAGPGEMSLLAVSVQFYADPSIVNRVAKENFWPEPEVDSCVVKLKVKSEKLKVHPVKSPPERGAAEPQFDRVNEKEFFRLVKIGFSAKRKMLKNNLAAGYKIDQKIVANKLEIAGFSQNIRAQELSVEDWVNLLTHFP